MNPTLSQDEKVHRELYQQAHAIFAVYNPTDQDYRLIFDRHLHIIPNKNKDIGKGKGIEYISAYLAKKYATEMTNKLLQEQAMKLVNDENDRRKAAGMALLTKYPGDNPQETIEAQIRVNDPETRKPIMQKLILGLVQKAPEDLVLADVKLQENVGVPVDEQIFNSFNEMSYQPQTITYTEPTVTPERKDEFVASLETQHEA